MTRNHDALAGVACDAVYLVSDRVNLSTLCFAVIHQLHTHRRYARHGHAGARC
jgi:hypothetical protein